MYRNIREIRFHWKTFVSKCKPLDNKGPHERSSPACWPVEPLPTQVIIHCDTHFNSVWNELRRFVPDGTTTAISMQYYSPSLDTSHLSIPCSRIPAAYGLNVFVSHNDIYCHPVLVDVNLRDLSKLRNTQAEEFVFSIKRNQTAFSYEEVTRYQFYISISY